MDDGARQRFEELMEKLKEQLLQSTFNQMSEGMQNMDPERMARMKDMLAELNQMLEQREQGVEPDFDGFMERFGDFFPATRRASTSCSSRWRSRWPRCSSSSTRCRRNSTRSSKRSPSPPPRGHGPALAGRPALAQPPTGSFPNMPWDRLDGQFRGDQPPLPWARCRASSTPSATWTDLEHLSAPGHPAERAGRGRRRPRP